MHTAALITGLLSVDQMDDVADLHTHLTSLYHGATGRLVHGSAPPPAPTTLHYNHHLHQNHDDTANVTSTSISITITI